MATIAFHARRYFWLLLPLAVWTGSAALGGPGERPATPPSGDEHIAQLIEQLGHPEYYTRQQAQKDLSRLGFEAFDALSTAATHDDLEIAARARYLLRLMQVEWTRDDDPPHVKTLLENYGWLQHEDRRERIEQMARLSDAAGAAALCRMIRFEQSSDLSKLAATELIAEYASGKSPAPDVVRTLRESLRESRRPGAQWLLVWAEHDRDYETLTEHFARFIDEEHASLKRQGSSANTDALAALLRFQVAWLERLDRRAPAIDAMRRLIALEDGEVENLRKLFAWLIAHRAWPLVDELVARFEAQITTTPALLYLLAEAQAEQGETDTAEQTAEQALALRQGASRGWLNERRLLALELWRRRRPEWAEREFRYVLERGAPTDHVTILAAHNLARMLHDRGEALRAAHVMETLVEQVKTNPALADQFGMNLRMFRGRMHYLYACHYHELKDYANERNHLDKALADDPGELDALIARYHLPQRDEPYHQETLEMIRSTAETLRGNIANQPDDAVWYNQFAWLIGNTEGDLDEALRYSQKSLELSPNEAAYYDTLAHVYFAKKDYANAVKHQRRAAELEPHSKLIGDQLDVFLAALNAP